MVLYMHTHTFDYRRQVQVFRLRHDGKEQCSDEQLEIHGHYNIPVYISFTANVIRATNLIYTTFLISISFHFFSLHTGECGRYFSSIASRNQEEIQYDTTNWRFIIKRDDAIVKKIRNRKKRVSVKSQKEWKKQLQKKDR